MGMNNYQQELREILEQIDESSIEKYPQKRIRIINEIIDKISKHQAVIDMDHVSDIASEYVEKINYAKQEIDMARRVPEKADVHLESVKEAIISAKAINWQMQEEE